MTRLLTFLITSPARLTGRALEGVTSEIRAFWRSQNRYEEVVPERIRQLAKARGIPKPNRYYR